MKHQQKIFKQGTKKIWSFTLYNFGIVLKRKSSNNILYEQKISSELLPILNY